MKLKKKNKNKILDEIKKKIKIKMKTEFAKNLERKFFYFVLIFYKF